MSFGILLWILVMLNAAMIVWGVIGGARIYRFTIFAAAVFTGFAIPQLIGLSNEAGIGWRHYLPEGALDLTAMVSVLCLAAIWFGDIMGDIRPGHSPIRSLSEYDHM